MDYEKKYKEALERAKQKIDAGFLTEDDLSYIFPELRESEDEWIRRRMVEHFKSKTKETWCSIPVKDILKWLEKQKVLTEHKEGIYYYHRDGTFTFISPPAVENPHNFTVPKPNEKPVDYDHEMWKNCEANFEGGKKEVIDHPEKYGLQKEQKPADLIRDQRQIYFMIEDGRRCGVIEGRKQVIDNPEKYGLQKPAEWSEDDKDYYDTIVRKLEVIGDDSGLSNNQIKFLREHCPSHCLEWSEEDERRIDAICELLENTSAIHPNYSHRKLIIWLKSLRPVKQEWSEEDEGMLIGIIERGSSQVPPSDPALREEQMEWLMNRLKSLRPSWKPSESQMYALKVALEPFRVRNSDNISAGNDKVFTQIESLYEDIKKL